MIIKDIFEKPIDRDIKGVIKVGQDDDENKKQELEEYVVTKQLQEHFENFFKAYVRGINGSTDKMGVWISGFFGSGKSHFLKILSYLLDNEEVSGKRAIDYFIDDNKIENQKVIKDMKLAASIPTDVVLFNIDSKSSSSASNKSKESILNVFLKVFNEMRGFSTNPHLANLERTLDEAGQYEIFQKTYEDDYGESWVSSRNRFALYKSRIVRTLAKIGFTSEEDAEFWFKNTKSDFKLSIEDFSKMVKDYLDSQGDNHHIVFLVDEVGQYIGDDTDLMLSLQTITEDLGTYCQGRAWIIVTSQQAIDEITKVKGDDFSKIQGRFDTRLNLTSANVDEVIKLRILEKNNQGSDSLDILYQNNENILKNLIVFNDKVEKRLYENKRDFIDVYPFINYQFDILSDVLTSIRTKGASGKHLSEGERSMLALFKESTELIKDREIGELVSFNMFFEGIKSFIDHNHSIVIEEAYKNGRINPEHRDYCFNVEILKTLFLIKYIDDIDSNVENITTLMVSNVSEDRRLLKDKVGEALKILESQNFIQKNGDNYIFLSDDEQELNREIKNQDIDPGEVTKAISEEIFDKLIKEENIRLSDNNNHIFGFNKEVDGRPYRSNILNDIGVKIYTEPIPSQRLMLVSSGDSNLHIDISKNNYYIEEFENAIKIERFLKLNSTKAYLTETIKIKKTSEIKEYKDRGVEYLEEALKGAKYFLNGEELTVRSTVFKENFKSLMEKLIYRVYHKLDYIEVSMNQEAIKALFKENKGLVIDNDTNELAVNELLGFVSEKTRAHEVLSMKAVRDKFERAPYGYLDDDIAWIMAKAFVDKKISLGLAGEEINEHTSDSRDIINYLIKKSYSDKLIISEKEIIDQRLINRAKNLGENLFNIRIIEIDENLVEDKIKTAAENEVENLKKLIDNFYKTSDIRYPGQELIEEYIGELENLGTIKSTKEFYIYLDEHEEDLLDLEEDSEPAINFFKGNQKKYWEESSKFLELYKDSELSIDNKELKGISEEIEQIFQQSIPYRLIQKLPELNGSFREIYFDELKDAREPIFTSIVKAKEEMRDELNRVDLYDDLFTSFVDDYENLRKKINKAKGVNQVKGYGAEIEIIREKHFRKINEILLGKQKVLELKNGPESSQEKEQVKIKQMVKLNTVYDNSYVDIENEGDIEGFIKELESKLKKQLREDVIIRIQF